MDDDRDSDEVEEQQAFRSGRVRIIGAQPADPTLSVPVVRSDTESNGAGDEEHHANGSAAPDPERASSEPDLDEPPAEPDLPHWTEAPTGEVPAVLSRDRGPSGTDDDPWSSLPAPTWREGEADWEVESQSFEPSMLSQGEAGIAPRKESEEAERQPWTFELPDQESSEDDERPDVQGDEDSGRHGAGVGRDRSVSGGLSDEETLVSPLDAFDVLGTADDQLGDAPGTDDRGSRIAGRFGWATGRGRRVEATGRGRPVEDADEVVTVRRRRGRGLHRPSAAEPVGAIVGDDRIDDPERVRLGDLDEGLAILAGDDPAVAGETGIEPPRRGRTRRQRGWRSHSGLDFGTGAALDEDDAAGAFGGLAAGGVARVTRSVRAARDQARDQRSRRAADAHEGPDDVLARPRGRARVEAPEPFAPAEPKAASRPEPDDAPRRPVPRAAPLAPGLRQTRPLRPPAAASAPPERRRAAGGRNMTAAVITGAVMLGLLLLVFHFGTVASVVVIAIIGFLATAEAYAAFRKAGYMPATPLGLLASVSLIWATYAKGQVALPLIVVLLVAFALIWFMAGVQPNADPVLGTTTTLFVFCWIGVFSSYAALLLNPTLFPDRHGIAFLLGGIVTGIACDVGALAVGRLWGRHPLAPSISPNKTWEGVIGGAVFAVVAGVAIVHFIHPWTLDKAVVLGVVVAIVAPLGDLCESLIKRHLGLKDMGRILPGHGGLLDRIDGLLFVLPATYYLVKAFHLG